VIGHCGWLANDRAALWWAIHESHKLMASKTSSRRTKPAPPSTADVSAQTVDAINDQNRADLFKNLFNHVLEGYAYCQIVMDHGEPQDFTFIDVNPAFEKLTHIKDVLGKKLSQVIPGVRESNPELIAVCGRVALTGQAERFEVHFTSLGALFAIRLYSQRKGYFIAVFEDITERKREEQKAELNERRFRALIENSAEAVTLLDATGVVLYDSPAAPGMLGYGPEEWIGGNIFELVHDEDASKVREVLRKLLETPTARFGEVFRVRHKDGSWRWIEGVAANLLAEPSVGAVVANYRDITERQKAEEWIQRQIQRLASLHEIDLAIASSFDLRTSIDILLEKVLVQLGVDAASVLLLDPYTNTLEFLAQRGFRRTKAIQSSSIPLGENYAGHAALERKTIQVHGSEVVRGNLRFHAVWREEAFESYFVVPLIAKGYVKGVLEIFHRTILEASADWMDFLSTLGGQAAIAIDNAQLFENLQRANLELTLAYDATIEGWSYALDLRDKETEGHTQRVTQMTLRLAERMGMSKLDIVNIRRGALLHDIGKMGVPDQILLKPGPLTPEEWVLMRQHPVFAYNMLSRIAYLRPVIDIPYCHHEKWDGSGYPLGLKGQEIPLAARVFAVVDVWDALHSDRAYRQGWPKEKVLAHIEEQSGKQFDPDVVTAFLDMLKKEPSLGDGH